MATRTGEDQMRKFVHAVCILAAKPGLMGIITAAYPTIGPAIANLVALCAVTGFDKVPETQP